MKTRKKKITAPLLLPATPITTKAKGWTRKKQSDEPVQDIIYNTSSVVYTKDILGRFTYGNDKLAQLLNTTVEKLIGKTVFDFCPEQYAKHYTAGDLEAMELGKAVELREDAIMDGRLRHLYTIKYPIYDQKGKISGVGGISTDITGFIINEKEAQQKLLFETTLHAQEKERTEIGLELHDNVSQLLATAKILINAAIAMPYKMDECLSKSKEFIMLGLKEIRNISHAMLPPPMDNNAFITAIKDMVEMIRMAGEIEVSIHLPAATDISKMNDQLKLSIYRIVQEQVSNILKHSKATKMNLDLSIGNYLELAITDNGIGNDDTKSKTGVGIRNIESRVKMHEGIMEKSANEKGGFSMNIRIPL